jgi:glucose-1-phosphate adenylyltransferase
MYVAKTEEYNGQNERLAIGTQERPPHIDMRGVACIILGGGEGKRLFPLTHSCCKPAISFGGRYRLIDVPISNSLHSDVQKIFVLTQFLSSSLHKHIFQTYRQEAFASGFIEVLGVEQRPNKAIWYQGTADAVRQNIDYLLETPAEYFLILSGDQLYHMNFRDMVHAAIQKDVDVLVATLPVHEADATRMGIMKVNEDHHIIDFQEKPTDPKVLQKMKTAPAILETMGLNTRSDQCFLGSMGIYLFKREALFDLLQQDERDDFGKHLIPTQVKKGNIAAFVHTGYWEDIGTIESFYRANMELTSAAPPFDCHNEKQPIYSTRFHLPGAKIEATMVEQSIICEGTICHAHSVIRSILGQRSVVGKGTVIKDAYIMGSDFYTAPVKDSIAIPDHFSIGENCYIEKAIIDKNVYIGNSVRLENRKQLNHFDGDYLYIRDGIIVVPRGSSIPDGFVI